MSPRSDRLALLMARLLGASTGRMFIILFVTRSSFSTEPRASERESRSADAAAAGPANLRAQPK